MTRAIEYTAALPGYKLGFFKMDQPSSDTKSYETDAGVLAAHGVNCFVLAGSPTREAIKFTAELHAKLPVGSVILGTSSLCNTGWTHAVPANVDPVLYCTTPVRRIASYPEGKQFSSRFSSTEHKVPTAYAFWGYLAGTLVANAINGIDQSDKRVAVMANLVNNVTNPEDYTFDTDGDLSAGRAGSTYGLDKVVSGIPKPAEVLTGRPALPGS
jgi:ABC-type branched-subunit amino acid transport system substrate-binding protein